MIYSIPYNRPLHLSALFPTPFFQDSSIYKIPLPLNILEAARERITWTLNTLPRVCVSFSGGKDSGLMLHLTAELARQMGKKICVLFIDWEAQFSCTINYVQSLRELYTDVIEEFYWVALPLTTQNSNPNGSAGNLMSNGYVNLPKMR